jgi:SEC-C motif domain protein
MHELLHRAGAAMLRAVNVPYQDAQALEAYCLPFIRGERRPDTAAELMASRYVAYTLGEIDYLVATHAPDTRESIDRVATEHWSRKASWLGLEIVSTEAGAAGDEQGEVEFIACYVLDGTEQVHHERSTFRRIDDRWYFVEGRIVPKKPVTRTGEKVGRNDPCACGSGKKSKKCCGARAS